MEGGGNRWSMLNESEEYVACPAVRQSSNDNTMSDEQDGAQLGEEGSRGMSRGSVRETSGAVGKVKVEYPLRRWGSSIHNPRNLQCMRQEVMTHDPLCG